MVNKLIKIEKRMNRGEAANKMRDIADKIEEGELNLSSGNDSVELRPSELVEFELEVEEEQDGDLSLEMEIEWSKDDAEDELEIS